MGSQCHTSLHDTYSVTLSHPTVTHSHITHLAHVPHSHHVKSWVHTTSQTDMRVSPRVSPQGYTRTATYGVTHSLTLTRYYTPRMADGVTHNHAVFWGYSQSHRVTQAHRHAITQSQTPTSPTVLPHFFPLSRRPWGISVGPRSVSRPWERGRVQRRPMGVARSRHCPEGESAEEGHSAHPPSPPALAAPPSTASDGGGGAGPHAETRYSSPAHHVLPSEGRAGSVWPRPSA